MTLVTTVDDDATGVLTNTAIASSATPDPDPTNDISSDSVGGLPDTGIEMATIAAWGFALLLLGGALLAGRRRLRRREN